MLFGNVDTFAVECELDRNHCKEWLLGRICYWVGGVRIGDYDLVTSLRDVLFQMKYIMHYCDNRNGGIFCNRTFEECFFIIDNVLYGSYGDANPPSDAPDELIRFDVTIPVDVFSDWKIYLIECGNNDIFIYRNINSELIQSLKLKGGSFDAGIKSFYKYLDKKYEHEISANDQRQV